VVLSFQVRGGVVVDKEEPMTTTAAKISTIPHTISAFPKFRKLIAVVSDPKHPPCLESY
jgi:hypothetical protein